jgi:hypothetical protein
MPVARYFFFVGLALLALLFVADAGLPKLPPEEAPRAAADLFTIRIHSNHKWPERVVIDTTLPTITPAANPANAMRVVNIPAASADHPTRGLVREAYAEAQPVQSKAPEPRRRRRAIARNHMGPPPILLAQQPRMGFFGNGFFGNNIR